MADITSIKVAVLATDGVEQAELTEPVKALKAAGAQVAVISPKAGQIQGMNHDQKGDTITVDHELSAVTAESFDALVLPAAWPIRTISGSIRRPSPSFAASSSTAS